MSPWLLFFVSGTAVAVAGMRLATDGDTIAEGTGLGGLWVGAILVAAVTSLPELITDVSAVRQGHPSLAVGDLFGSSMANMMILAIADTLTRSPGMLTRVTMNQALVGTLGVALTVLAAIGILASLGVGLFGIGLPVVLIGVTYAAGMRLIHRNRAEPPFRTEQEVAAAKPDRRRLRRAAVLFALSAAVIVVAGPYLAHSGAELAVELGVSTGFVGMLFLAIATSLPEAAVSMACVRSGAYNLAVGNLLGSNCFNMAALVVLDVADGGGSLLARVDQSLAVGAMVGVLLMTLAMLDLMNRSERRPWAIKPGPVVMMVTYVAGLYLMFRLS